MAHEHSIRHAAQGDEVGVDQRPTVPPPPRASGVMRKVVVAPPLDPLEEALLARPLWDSRAPEPAVHEILYRFAMGDAAGAVACAEILLDGRRVPALTVSFDVLDELPLDPCAVLFLGRVDGATSLSRVVDECGLDLESAVRTVCALLDRHIIVLRAAA